MILPTKLKYKATQLEGQDLYNYLASLHKKHWSIRSIATALELSPTTITKYIGKGKIKQKYLDTIPIPDEMIPVEEVPTNDYHRLRSLSLWARKASSTNPSPRAAQASKDLNVYLRILFDEGYNMRRLSECCGVSRTAISQRLAKTDEGDYTREDLP